MGWRKHVTRCCSLATRTLDRVLIAGVAAGKFIFAVKCERLLRRLRRRAVGASLSLFGVWLSIGHGGDWLGSLDSTLGTCRVSALGTWCELVSFRWLR